MFSVLINTEGGGDNSILTLLHVSPTFHAFHAIDMRLLSELNWGKCAAHVIFGFTDKNRKRGRCTQCGKVSIWPLQKGRCTLDICYALYLILRHENYSHLINIKIY